MKKILASIASLAMLLLLVSPVLAVKPNPNLAAAQKVDWNLSGAVMPLPWGQHDVIGSDTASKLIVNQPNGATEVAITGVMNGLLPNTIYTVYPSNAWTQSPAWDVTGNYIIDLTYNSVHYTEYLVLQQSGSNITGTSLALAGDASPWTIDSGTVIGNVVHIYGHFNSSPSMLIHMTATIAPDGSMIDGSWNDIAPGTRSGTWSTTTGYAISHQVGNGYPGLFRNLQPFTFVTDEFGSGSWHLNLRDGDFNGAGTYSLSIWVNGAGATVLISDNFDVVVN